jgi:transposase-like protein
MLSTIVDGGASSLAKKKTCSAKGKRYSKAQKEEILEYAKANSVEAAAAKFNVTGCSIYEWRRALKRRGGKDASPGGEVKIEVADVASAPGLRTESGSQYAQAFRL